MNEMQRLIHSYRNLIISCVLILVSVAGTIFIIWPAAKKVSELRADIGQLQEKNDRLKRKITILEQIDEPSYVTTYAELLRAVPADQSLVTLFATIDGLGAASGIALGDFALSRGGGIASQSADINSSVDKKIGSAVLGFSITMAGTYDQLLDFLTRVAQVRRVVRVRSFDLTYDQGQKLSANLQMDAFYKPYPSAIAAVDAAIEPLSQSDSDMIAKVSGMPIVVGVGDAINPAQTPQATLEHKENLFEP